jgi:RsmE family RNA methyltransferase
MNIVLFGENEFETTLPLSDERAKHCIKILHKKVGDSIEAGIINGKRGRATILSIDEKGLKLSFTPTEDFSADNTNSQLILIIGFPRPIQLKRLLRDVTSVGVDEIHLCATELGEKSYMDSNLTREDALRRSLIEGAMQAKTTKIPRIFLHKSLSAAISAVKTGSDDEQLLCLDIQENASELKNCLEEGFYPKTVLAIGSERGWSEKERQLFSRENFRFAVMGSRILRTETAAICASFLFQILRGEK